MDKKDFKKLLDDHHKETRRHFDVVAEDLKNHIQIVSEQVGANTEKLEEYSQKFDTMNYRLENIENTLEAVNLPALKQKVFTLEKRITTLESNLNKK
jgi:predicted  nucleic acid-binding Zn-ribbon protein